MYVHTYLAWDHTRTGLAESHFAEAEVAACNRGPPGLGCVSLYLQPYPPACAERRATSERPATARQNANGRP